MVKLESESESSLRTSGRLQSRREHGVGQDWSFLRGKSRKGKELPQVKEEFKVDDIKEEAKSTDNKATVKQSANMIPKKGSPSSQSRMMKEEETPSLPRAAVKQEVKNEIETSSAPPDPAQSAIIVKTLEEAMKVEPSQRSPRSKRNDTTTGGPAQGSSQGVKVKREASPDVLPPMDVNHPTPAGTKVDETVTVRQESPAPQQLTPDEKEAREQLWRSKISKKVKSENLRFDLNVLWSRLVTAGIPPDLFPITLDREIRDVCVSRVFMSKMWGGSSQEAFPHIGKDFTHGLTDFMYPGPDSQPGAPEVPGAPGLWLDLEDETGTHWIASGGERPKRLFTRIMKQPCLWQYQGQYRVRIAETLTAEEWRQQKATVRKAWAKNMSKDKMYEGLREYLVAKRFLGKEPDDYEIQQLRAGSMSTAMSEEEIQLCMTRGDLKMGVYTMECVGYDEEFQRQVAEKWANWVPPPTGKKRKAQDQLAAKTRKKKKTGEKKGKGKVEYYAEEEEELSDVESGSEGGEDDGDDEVDGAAYTAYVPSGTRSRPRPV